MSDLHRRQLLAAAALTTTAALAASSALAQAPSPSPPAALSPQPLPFDPKSIPGLSERLLVSHHDNNYAGAVNRIGQIQAQLRQLDMATAPGFQVNGLKREELLAMNSMLLHETYFACLGKGGAQPASALGRQIEKDFGSHAKWRDEFTAMGKALGGGSGWVLLSWSPRAARLINQWAFDHTMTLADGRVLVALDMYEHAYHMDFGARAADYVNAYMTALDWAHADRQFARAQTQ
jgi:Fe-Mn family superoxide dismutase